MPSNDRIVQHIEEVRETVTTAVARLVGAADSLDDASAELMRRLALESVFMAGFALASGLVGNVRPEHEPREIALALADIAWKDSDRRLRVLVGDPKIVAEIMNGIDFGPTEN